MPTPLERFATATTRSFDRQEGRPNVAFDMENAELVDENNKTLDWDIFSAVTKVDLTLTVTGASSLIITCQDPEFELLNDPIFSKWMFKREDVSLSTGRNYSARRITDSKKAQRYGEESELEWILPEKPIDLNLDGIWFRLAGFRVNKTDLILTFEDRIAAMLREKPGFTTVNRGDLTRAQFIHKLIREVEKRHGPIRIFIPEERIAQPVAESAKVEKAEDLKTSAIRALGPNDGITVKGQPATSDQLKVLNEALEEAVELKAPFKAQVALVAALITENTVSNPDPGTPADEGALSLEDATAKAIGINPYDIKAVAGYFLKSGFTGKGGAITIARTQPHLTPANIAQQVQGSGAGEATDGQANYGPYVSEAEHSVRVFGGTASNESTEATVPGPYAFSRGPNETTWDACQRLASEVSWYFFVRDNTIWYVSGNFLLAQEPQMHVERGEEGVDWVEPNVDIGARDNIAEVKVEARAQLWTAVAGNAASVARVGPANGRWVITTIEIDVLDRSDKIAVTLQKTLPARLEPASGEAPVGVGELGEGASARGAEAGSALAAFYASDSLSQMELPYKWGGGHTSGSLAKVHKGGEGLDCSGSTCWVLHEAGMFPSLTAEVSGSLETWGAAGEGKEMTVWANADHVFIEFNIAGHGRAQMNTNGPVNGPRLYTLSQTMTYNPHPSTEGYVARHWPGT